MADIYLKFGVLGGDDIKTAGTSGHDILKDLTSIVNQINQNPLPIKFTADQTSLQKFRDDIKQVSDDLSKFGHISINIQQLTSIESSLATISSEIQKITKAGTGFGKMLEVDSSGIDDVIGKLEEVRTLVDNINSGGGGKGGSGSRASNKTFYNMVAEMQRLISGNQSALGASPAYQQVSSVLQGWVTEADNVRSGTKTLKQALDDLGLTGKTNAAKLQPMTETLAKLKEELAVTGNTGTVTGQKLSKLYTKMRTTLDANRNAMGTQEYADLERQLNLLKPAVDALSSNGYNAELVLRNLNGTIGSTKQIIQEAQNVLDNFTRSVRDAGTAGTTTETQIKNMVSKLNTLANSAGVKILDTNNGTNAQNLITQAEKLETMWSNPGTNAKQMADELAKADALLVNIKAEVSKISAIPLKDNIIAQNAALNKVQSTIESINRDLNNWTAAVGMPEYGTLEKARDAMAGIFEEADLGNITLGELNEGFAKAFSGVPAARRAIKDAGKDTKSLTDKMGSLTEKFSTWFSVSQIIMGIVRGIRQMITNVSELDSAMTELRKVTNETEASYTQFLTKATERAKKLGATITDVVKATADFARLGFSVEDASTLADAATVYKNVGDGIESIDDASASIISTMQAFGVAAQDAMTIVDRFNEVGKNIAERRSNTPIKKQLYRLNTRDGQDRAKTCEVKNKEDGYAPSPLACSNEYDLPFTYSIIDASTYNACKNTNDKLSKNSVHGILLSKFDITVWFSVKLSNLLAVRSITDWRIYTHA